MQFSLQPDIKPFPASIEYTDNILLIGSCFTEHISERLAQHKFKVYANPHGILFNPLSVADSLERYVSGTEYAENDLFYLNELWNSWAHHTRFSHTDKMQALHLINQSLQEASWCIKKAKWVIITLGSAFQYYLKENNRPVANNHRAPGQWFEKRLLSTDVIRQRLQQSMDHIIRINPAVHFLFTISPVRHIRDGVVDNNRSKARLIEAVHSLCENNEHAYYFPAYELVIDILRDYRFYDIDFVHPNYSATQYVWEWFVKACMNENTRQVMENVNSLVTAKKHRPRFPETAAHRKFLNNHLLKTQALMKEYPYLDLKEEEAYFNQ